MNIEQFREYCLAKKAVTEEFPFGMDTLVFKVAGKMFALTTLNEDFSMNLKADPDWALELRESYYAVKPGFHMNKKHWNTVNVDGSINDYELKKMIDHSYDMVVEGMAKKKRDELR